MSDLLEKPKSKARAGGTNPYGGRGKPLAAKVIDGNTAKDGKEKQGKVQEAYKSEMTLTELRKNGVPKPPECFDKVARDKWYFLFTELQLYLKTIDVDSLRMYCEAWSEYVDLTERIRVEGFTVLGVNGNTVKNPIVSARTDSVARIKDFGSRLGLDPSSRAKILLDMAGAKKPEADDPWDGLLDGSRR